MEVEVTPEKKNAISKREATKNSQRTVFHLLQRKTTPTIPGAVLCTHITMAVFRGMLCAEQREYQISLPRLAFSYTNFLSPCLSWQWMGTG